MGSEIGFRRCLVQSFLITVIMLVACPLKAATNVKLSGTMPAFGDIAEFNDFQISPDGRYLVYRADQDTDQVFELYSVSLTGGVPIRLNPLLPVGRSVESFQISPDSSRVIYLADQETDGVTELYSVPIRGPAGSGIKLNRVLAAGGYVHSFEISPDSSRVVYTADQQTDDVIELYSVPIAGPAEEGIKINKISLSSLWSISNFQISPDSSRVVYRIEWVTSAITELYSVPIGGPAASGIKLNGVLATGGDVHSFQISPDSARVVYRADQDTDEVIELYSVPIGGPAASGIKLNGVLAAGGYIWHFQISPDSSRVVYRAEEQVDNVTELYSAPIGGPAASGIKLNGVLAPGGAVRYFRVSPDSSRVVYTADQQTDEVIELYSVPIGGPAASGIKLNGALAAGGNVVNYLFNISPDSSRVVYTADQETNTVFELYSVPIGGPAASGIKLNGTLADDGDVHEFQISPDSSRVVYIAAQETLGVTELFGVPFGGPAASGFKLNGVLTAGGAVMYHHWFFQISPDSSRVFYVADQDTDGVLELYMTSFDDTPDPFAFTDLIGVPLNTAMISNPITVSGINTGAPISISGGEYSINGGVYTSSPGTVNKGDRITVRLTSSSSFSNTTEAALTIGGISDTFSLTTLGLINLYLPLILNH